LFFTQYDVIQEIKNLLFIADRQARSFFDYDKMGKMGEEQKGYYSISAKS
jgi:hypothetical protein